MADMGSERGQVSLSLVEAVVGLLVVLAAATTFLVGLPDAGAESEELDVLAADGLAALGATPPTEDGASRLSALARARGTFTQEARPTDDQLRALYPETVRYHLETPHGTVGTPVPPSRTFGQAQAYRLNTWVTLRVWIR